MLWRTTNRCRQWRWFRRTHMIVENSFRLDFSFCSCGICSHSERNRDAGWVRLLFSEIIDLASSLFARVDEAEEFHPALPHKAFRGDFCWILPGVRFSGWGAIAKYRIGEVGSAAFAISRSAEDCVPVYRA